MGAVGTAHQHDGHLGTQDDAGILGAAEQGSGLADAVSYLIIGHQQDVSPARPGGSEVLVTAGFLTDGQIQCHGATDIHIVLGPAVGHVGQRIGIHGGLHLGVHLLCPADAGGIDVLVAQGLQHHGGVLQDLGLFVQVGEGVDTAVGEKHHPVQRGDLIEHAVGGEVGGAQAVLLIEYGPHQVGGSQNTLHQEVGPALCAQGYGLGSAVGIAVAGHYLIGGRILAQSAEHGRDLLLMAHQNGGGNALAAGIHHGFDHRLVVGGSYGDDTGPAAAGGGNNAINGMYHTFSSCVAQILCLCKAKIVQFYALRWDDYTSAHPPRQQ